ncbi:acyltransferase family protein [Priestia megaterium]|uniref:acyltransferase family protein n=1 Tax=Priestia megaterium TaxID=1404 RepID=UPI0035E05083
MSRNPYFDNLKAVLILLVVLGHTLSEAVNENKWVASIYMFIYLFHMPAFILVSGYFSKVIKTKKDVWKLAKKFLIPYVIFQVIYTLYYTKVYGNKLEMTFLEPRWALWFLISIFCWNLLLYIFPKNRVGLLLAVGVSLVAGYVGSVNETLTFARTFFFFPFFLIGYLLDEPRFTKLKIKRNVVISWLIFISLFVVVYYFGNIAWKEWLYGRIPYSEISQGPLEYGFVNRAIVYLFMAAATYCFLSIAPKKQLSITKIGSLTLIIYLFHMFILKYIQTSPVYDWVEHTDQYYVLFLLPIIVVYLLTRKAIVKLGLFLMGIQRKRKKKWTPTK